MPLALPKFPHHWSEISAQAKGLLTPNEEKKKKLQKPEHEDHSEAHQLFRSVLGHSSSVKRKPSCKPKVSRSARPKDTLKPSERSVDKLHTSALTTPNDSDHEEDDMLPGINSPGSTGVIFVMDRAMANGFTYDDPDWANFGQGAPEVGDIPGASKKPEIFDVAAMGEDVHEYAPTTGVKALRTAVADLYNQTYRKGMSSQYTFENVCIVPGGRSGLTRVASVVGEVYVGYQLPEYTAYDQMLSVFRRLVPIPSALSAEDNYKLHIDKLNENIHQMGLSVLFASNPRNPTGQAVEGNELKELVQISRNGQTVVLDEFYSWYNLDGQLGESLSAAKYVEDVNKDALVIIDGLTKNCLSDLPSPLNSGLVFFEELLKHKVIVVPGIFFDINPSHRRNLFCSPCHHFVRLSFGPPLPQLEKGLDGIEQVLKKAHEHLANEGDLSGMGKDLAKRISIAAIHGVADSSKLTSPIE